MTKYLKTAIKAALEAGKKILEVYNSEDFDISIKSDNSPFTKADKEAHNLIFSYLEKTNIPVLSEEGKEIPYKQRKSWGKLWIIDPIDGTKEFIKRNGEFTVNIALVEGKKPVIGVIFVPVHGILYYSEARFGSFKVKIDPDTFKFEGDFLKGDRLPLSPTQRPFTIVTSRSHNSYDTNVYIEKIKVEHDEVNIISKGSSLKLCMVAEGKVDRYPRFAPTMEWDTAAGQAICEFAGFKVIDLETKESILYNKSDLRNNWFIAK